MSKLLQDKEYIAHINILSVLLKRKYELSDADLQRLKYEIHKIIEKVVD